MPQQYKQDQVKELKEKLARAKSFAIVNYENTSVADQVEIRSKLKSAGAEFTVAKNTLVNLALKNEELSKQLAGMNAIVFSYEDEIAGFKQIVEFNEEHDKLEVKGGLMDDKVLTAEEILKLSKLPGKAELIGQLIARLNGPAFGLVNVLQASQRNLVYVLKNIAEKQTD